MADRTDGRLVLPEDDGFLHPVPATGDVVPPIGGFIQPVRIHDPISIGSAIEAGLSTALPRAGAGLLRFPIAAPATQLAEVGVPGAEFVARQTTRLADYLDETAAAAENRKHPDFRIRFTQALAERPDLIFNPAWWTEDLVEVGTSFGASILAGLATAAITKNPIAATMAAVAVGGGLEASPVYKKVLDSTGDPDEAFRAGALMFGGVAALSSLPTGMLFSRMSSSGLRRKLPYMFAVASGEAITEALEEPLEAVITGENVRDTVTQMIDIMPASFILSFLTAGVFSGVESFNEPDQIVGAVKDVPIAGSAEYVQKELDTLTSIVNDNQKLFNLGIAQQALNRGTAEGLASARNIVDGVAISMDRNPEEKSKLVEQAVGQLEKVADAALDEQKQSQTVLEKILAQPLPGEVKAPTAPIGPTSVRDIDTRIQARIDKLTEQGVTTEEIAEDAILRELSREKETGVAPIVEKVPSKHPIEMTEDELEKALIDEQDRVRNLDENILGKEDAVKFNKALRQLESNNPNISDQGQAFIDSVEDRLAPEDFDALFGIGEEGLSAEALKEHLEGVRELDTSSPEALGRSLRIAITDIGDGDVSKPETLNLKQSIAATQLAEAMRIAQEKGWDTKTVSDAAVQAVARRFTDPVDAEFMLRRFKQIQKQLGIASTVKTITQEPKPKAKPKPKVTPKEPNLSQIKATTIPEFEKEVKTIPKDLKAPLVEFKTTIDELKIAAKKITTNPEFARSLEGIVNELNTFFVSAAKRGTIPTMDSSISQYVKDIKESFGLFAKSKKARAERNKRFKSIAAKAEKVHDATISDKGFTDKSDTHTAFLQFWRTLGQLDTISPDQVEVLKDIFKDADLEQFGGLELLARGIKQESGILVGATASSTVPLIEAQHPLPDSVAGQEFKETGALTFLHELAHVWHNHIADPTVKKDIASAYKRIGRTKAQQYMLNAGFNEEDSTYYASNDQEFFAQSFAIYSLNRSIPSKEYLSLFQRVMQTIKATAERLFETKSPNKKLESIYDKILNPSESTPAPPKVVPVKYNKSQAELTPEEYEDVFDQFIAYMEGAEGNKATLQQVVDWLNREMYNVAEDKEIALIEAATLVDDDAFSVDGSEGNPNTVVTLREKVDEQPPTPRTKEEIQQEINDVDQELSSMIEEMKADGSTSVDIDMDIVVRDLRREMAELKKKKKTANSPEPVSDSGVPTDTVNKAPNWMETLRSLREQADGIVKRYTIQQQGEEISSIPDKWLDLKIPEVGKGNHTHTLTSMNDHILFGNVTGVEVNMNSVMNKLFLPKLITRQGISLIPSELNDAVRQLKEATSYLNDMQEIGPFVDSILKSDARVMATRVEGIGRKLGDMQPYIKSEGEQSAFKKLQEAHRDARTALTAYGITSNTLMPSGHDMRMLNSAQEARADGTPLNEWEIGLNPDNDAGVRRGLRLSWELSKRATMRPTTDQEMAYKEYKVRPNGTIKATKSFFVTRKMAEAIDRYKGQDIKQSILKPITFLLEQMDKVMPGVGFARLIDNYQAALRQDKEYTDRVITDMKQALAGVNTLELGMYAAVQDTPKMAGYLKAKKVDITAVLKRVRNNDKAMEAYALGRRYFNEMWTDINASREKLGFEAIPFRPDYFTFIRMNEELNANFSDMLTASLSKIQGAFESVQEALGNRRDQASRFQFTERKEGPKPIDLEYGRVFQKYTRIASKHMHLSPTIMAVAELTGPLYIPGDGEMKVTGLRSTGKDGMDNMVDQLNRWKSILAGNPSRAEFGAGLSPGMNKIIGRLTTNVATYTMGYAIRTFVIQPTANYLTALSIGPQYIYKNGLGQWAKWAFHGDAAVQRKLDLSNHLPTRTIEAQIEDIKDRLANLTPTNAWESLQFFGMRVQAASFSIIQLFDMWTAKIGWLGTFDYAKDRGMTDGEARDIADRLIAKTHGSAAPGLRAPIQRTPYGRALTLFQTFQLNEFAYIVNEVLNTESMTIPGQEQAQAKLEGLTEKLTAQGVAAENIDAHPEMQAMKQTLKNLGKINTLDDMKKERIRRILMYLLLGAFINAFYEDFLGINSPLPAPIRATWQAYANDDEAISIAAQPFLEIIKQVPIIGGGAYGGGLGGAGMDFIDDITDVLSGKKGAKRASSELMGKLFGIPLLNQINKSMRSADQGGSNFEVAIGMYPGHRRLLLDIIEGMSSGSSRVGL